MDSTNSGQGVSSESGRHRWRPDRVVFGVVLVVLFLFYSWLPLWHTDIWGHLAFGRWMVAHAQLPEKEPFTPFSRQDSPLGHFQWLSQTGLYLVYHVGESLSGGDALERTTAGVLALRTLHGGLAVLFFGGLILAFRRLGASLGLTCLFLLLTLLLRPAFTGAVLRPQFLGLVCFVLLLALLSRLPLHRGATFLLLLLFVLWANLHGSFVVGLITIFLVMVGRALEIVLDRPAQLTGKLIGDGILRQLVRVFFLCLLATLWNPHGPWLYWHLVEMAGNPNIGTLFEWRPLFAPFAGVGMYWGLAFGLLLVLVTQLRARERLKPTEWLLLACFLLWACWQRRMLNWWLILVPWILVRHWANPRPLLPTRIRFPVVERVLTAGLVLLALVLSPLGMSLLRGHLPPLKDAVHPGTPWQLADALSHLDSRDESADPLTRALRSRFSAGKWSGTIFASETQGDYLIWALGPRIPIFVYTHVHLFAAEHWQDCLRIKLGADGWDAILDNNAINLIVIEPAMHPRLSRLLREDPRWAILEDSQTTATGRDALEQRLIALRRQPVHLINER